MAHLSEFTCFDELTEDLQLLIVGKIRASKDFVNFKAAQKGTPTMQKEIHNKFCELYVHDFNQLIWILHKFTTECLGVEKKFSINEKARDSQLKQFVQGYPGTNLLDDEKSYEEYNYTFDLLINEIEYAMTSGVNPVSPNLSCTQIMNNLRFKNDMNDIAKQLLFKRVEEDHEIEHELALEFESGVKLSVNIYISHAIEDPQPTIHVMTRFSTTRKNRSYTHKYIISGEDEEYDYEENEQDYPVWINNNPTGWILAIIAKLRRKSGKREMLGGVKHIDYKYTGEQFWVKAYFLQEVLPKLADL